MLNTTATYKLNYPDTGWYGKDTFFFDKSNININAEDMVYYFTDTSSNNTSYNSAKAFRYPKIYIKSGGSGKPILCKSGNGGNCNTTSRVLTTTYNTDEKTLSIDCGSDCKAAMQCPILLSDNSGKYAPKDSDFSNVVSASKILNNNIGKKIKMFNVDSVGSTRPLNNQDNSEVSISKDNIAHLTYLFTNCYDTRAGNNRGNKDNIVK
jgi:hypothetical protein